MAIEIRNGIKCEYMCNTCGINYLEQRNIDEPQFFTSCQKFGCSGVYELINQTEFTYEQYIPDPIIENTEE